jgi:hypothetical protein
VNAVLDEFIDNPQIFVISYDLDPDFQLIQSGDDGRKITNERIVRYA